jgi:hypothetical protein
MQLQERSYGGQLFRPRPEIHISDNNSLVIIATPWGPAEAAKDFIELVTASLRNADSDPDQTVVFLKVDTLSTQENNLRMAIMSAHEDIRDKYNDDVASAGLEVFCLIKNEKKVTWFQMGAPATSLIRENKHIPIHHPLDLSFDFSRTKVLPPLPKDLIGLQNHIHLELGTFRWRHNDKLLLISRSYVPYELFKHEPQELNLDSVTKILSEDNQDHPFWLGILEL